MTVTLVAVGAAAALAILFGLPLLGQLFASRPPQPPAARDATLEKSP